jgi:hypothetical protein
LPADAFEGSERVDEIEHGATSPVAIGAGIATE